jgi:YTV
MREERYIVQKPVTETVQQTQYRTVMSPVTTYTTQYADQGCFQDQVSCVPGSRSWPRLAWGQPQQFCDPATGAVTTVRGGLAWVQTTTPARQVVNRVWKPNIVAVQVPQTSFVAQQVAECVPVQVCKMVAEEQVRQVPVQVCKMVQEEQVRKVPYTTCRQVVERVERQVPVQVCKYVTEERVRQIPVTTCKIVREEHVEPYEVKVCKIECRKETVQVPRVVAKQVPVTYTYRVPKTVVLRVPVDPCDG